MRPATIYKAILPFQVSSQHCPGSFTSITWTMERNQQRGGRLSTMRKTLFDQGYLDEQFIQLEELQDDANPNFVEEVVTLFYRDSVRIIQNLEQALNKNPCDFSKLENYLSHFKGSCSSIGAKRVQNECAEFRDYCREGDIEGCKRSFQQMKSEYGVLKRKLETYFQLAKQAGPSAFGDGM